MNLKEKISSLKVTNDDLFLVAAFVLVALVAFGVGRLSVKLEQTEEFEVVYPGEVRGAAAVGGADGGGYVASKTGATYSFPWCGSAQAIKPQNRVIFATKEDAEAAGYRPAGNCKGL